jgi:ribose transport system substrate-binding protein
VWRGAASAGAGEETLALVTNASADFWTIARRGTEKAATELPNYNVEMHVVSEATAAEQRRILDDLLTKGVAGVSISSIDSANSTDILNKVASRRCCSRPTATRPRASACSTSAPTTRRPACRPAS